MTQKPRLALASLLLAVTVLGACAQTKAAPSSTSNSTPGSTSTISTPVSAPQALVGNAVFQLSSPRPNGLLNLPITLSGLSKSLAFIVELQTQAGDVLAHESVNLSSSSAGMPSGAWYPFSVSLQPYSAVSGPEVLVLFEYLGPNGTQVHRLAIPVSVNP
ncbi:MAG: hypothetical protein NT160_07190 [Actinobacteria bacterium]|nr:hypothetical protein [Actinomycetota bacterium]